MGNKLNQRKLMRKLLTPEIKQAMRNYYLHRKAQEKVKWDKDGDLAALSAALHKSPFYTFLQACVGTFWVTWGKANVQTRHDEKNYWIGRLVGRKVEGKWVEVGELF